MIVNSSQNISSSGGPLGSSETQRVNKATRTSNSNTDEKAAEKVQKQVDESVLRELRARDREVRAHEAAHVAVGSGLVRSGPSYTFQQGPDGRSYAIGGEVQLDVSPVANDPEATIVKQEQVRKAALAPAQPSVQDTRVAASANQLASRARIDLAVQRKQETQLAEEQNNLEKVSNEPVDPAQTDTGVQVDSSKSVNSAAATSTDPSGGRIPPADSIVSNTGGVKLQSNDSSASAAASNFMTAAKPVQTGTRFNLFV